MRRLRAAAASVPAPPDRPATDSAETEGDVVGVLVKHHTWVRRRPRRGYWAAGLLCVVGLTALAAPRTQPVVESTLRTHVRAALQHAGLDPVRVQVEGRSVTLGVPTGVHSQRAVRAAAAVDGVASVDAVDAYASRREARACRTLAERLDRVTRGQRIPFVGRSTRLAAGGVDMVAAAARLLRACPRARVVVGGHTDAATVNGPTLSLRRAELLVRLLVDARVARARLVPRGYGDQFLLHRGGPGTNQRGSIEALP